MEWFVSKGGVSVPAEASSIGQRLTQPVLRPGGHRLMLNSLRAGLLKPEELTLKQLDKIAEAGGYELQLVLRKK